MALGQLRYSLWGFNVWVASLLALIEPCLRRISGFAICRCGMTTTSDRLGNFNCNGEIDCGWRLDVTFPANLEDSQDLINHNA